MCSISRSSGTCVICNKTPRGKGVGVGAKDSKRPVRFGYSKLAGCGVVTVHAQRRNLTRTVLYPTITRTDENRVLYYSSTVNQIYSDL